MNKNKEKEDYFKRIKFMLDTKGHIKNSIQFGFLALTLSELNTLLQKNLITFKLNLIGSLICSLFMIYHFSFSCYIMIKNYIIQRKWSKK